MQQSVRVLQVRRGIRLDDSWFRWFLTLGQVRRNRLYQGLSENINCSVIVAQKLPAGQGNRRHKTAFFAAGEEAHFVDLVARLFHPMCGVASTMCASARNINIKTPPLHPHPMRGVARNISITTQRPHPHPIRGMASTTQPPHPHPMRLSIE